jgi:xanthine dehydrogenase molybdopterin-binding subunit B
MEERSWSAYSFGARFYEVAVDEVLGCVTVQCWVAVFSAGRILSEKTARSQLLGGIVWGIGQSASRRDDPRWARQTDRPEPMEYLVPVNADTPPIEVLLVPEAGSDVNPAGAKGLGELGICGATAAIANAIFHATARRLRNVPDQNGAVGLERFILLCKTFLQGPAQMFPHGELIPVLDEFRQLAIGSFEKRACGPLCLPASWRQRAVRLSSVVALGGVA